VRAPNVGALWLSGNRSTVPVHQALETERLVPHAPCFSEEKSKMKIQPLHDRIVVEAAQKEEKTASGIILPDTAQEKPQRGKVLAVGPGKRLDSGQLAAMDVKVGDTVMYGKYGGTEVTVEGKDYVILRADDVLAIVK
jgi:chaperonin GroES